MLREGLKAFALAVALSALTAKGDTLVANFSYDESDFEITTKDGGGETFDYINLPDECHLSAAGEPMLPLVTATFAVPWGSTVNSIAVTDSASEILEGDYYVYPAQEPYPISNGEGAPWTPPDPAVYGSYDPYPGDVLQDGGPATSRGHLLYYFNIVPMQYTAADEEIELYTFIEVTLDYTPPAGQPEPTRMEHAYIYDRWSAVIGRMVANGDDVVDFREPVNFVDVNRVVEMEYGGDIIDVVEEAESQYYEYSAPPEPPADYESKAEEMTYPYLYVIITNNYWQHDPEETPPRKYVGDLVEKFTDTGWPIDNPKALRRYKTRKGFPVTVRTVDWIKQNYAGADAQEKVQKFVNAAYNDWGTAFVLLAGDVERPQGYGPVFQPNKKVWLRSGRYGVVPLRHLCDHPYAHLDPEGNPAFWPWGENIKTTPGDVYYSAVDGWDLTHWDGNGNDVYGQKIEGVEMWSFAPDVAVGRVAVGNPDDPTESVNEVGYFQDKVYKYETAPMGWVVPPTPPYLEKTLLLATENWADDTDEIAEYIQLPDGKKDTTLYEEGSTGSDYIRYPRSPEPHNVIEKMDENFGITFIYCHGCPYCFYTLTHRDDYIPNPYIQSTPAKKEYAIPYHADMVFPVGIDDLTNHGLGVLYTVSCDVNRVDLYTVEDCLGEVYVLKEYKGGVAFLGNNKEGRPGASNDLAKEFFDYLFDASTQDPNDGVPEAGLAEAFSKRKTCGPTGDRFITYTHDLNGEPEFSIYTDEPHIFGVDYDVEVLIPGQDYLIKVTVNDGANPVEKARVCLWILDQSIHLVGETDAQGEIWFRSPRASASGCTKLTVSRAYETNPAYPFIVHVSNHSIP